MLEEVRTYYDKQKKVLYELYYVDRYLHKIGEYKSWHENRQQQYHYFLKDSMLDGECKEWYLDGTLKKHCFYKDNMLHGENKIWYKSGQLKIDCYYSDGMPCDEYKRWFENGTIALHAYLVDGELYHASDTTKEDLMMITLKSNKPIPLLG